MVSLKMVMFYNTKEKRYMSVPLKPYYAVFRGNSDIYIETWNVTKIFKEDDGKKWRLDIAYLPFEYDDDTTHQMRINYQCEKNEVEIKSLAYLTIPPDKFDEYAKREGITPLGE